MATANFGRVDDEGYVESQEELVEREIEAMWASFPGATFLERCAFIQALAAWTAAGESVSQARTLAVIRLRLDVLVGGSAGESAAKIIKRVSK